MSDGLKPTREAVGARVRRLDKRFAFAKSARAFTHAVPKTTLPALLSLLSADAAPRFKASSVSRGRGEMEREKKNRLGNSHLKFKATRGCAHTREWERDKE